MNFYKELTRFQKQFLCFFSICSIIVFLLPLYINNFKSVFSFLGILGLISTICGILVSIYIARTRPVAYLWWCISTLLMAIICFASHLYGQFIQNLFLSLPIQIYGYVLWKRSIRSSESKSLQIRKMNLKQWGITLILTIISWILYSIFLYYLPNILKSFFNINIAVDPNIIMDSLTAILAIIASVLTNLRFIEQWYLWIIYDSIAIITFIIQIMSTNYSNVSLLIADISNTLNLIQYITGVIYGYIIWIKLMKGRKTHSIEKELT